MLAFCPTCWNEITTSPTICRKCGAKVEVYSQEYEKSLLDLIPGSPPAKRVEICLVLGQREKGSAVPHLSALLYTHQETIVLVAVLRALGQIADTSALQEIAKIAADEKSPVCELARQIISMPLARANVQAPVRML